MLLLVTMMGVSAVVSYLVVRLRVLVDLESQHAHASEQLRVLGETLRETRDARTQGEVLQALLIQNTGCEVSVLLLQDAGSEQATTDSQWVGEPQGQDVQGLWACVQQMGAMGPGTGRHENQSTVFLPLRGHVRALGAVALHGHDGLNGLLGLVEALKRGRFGAGFGQQCRASTKGQTGDGTQETLGVVCHGSLRR